jgi:hypothetical protein
MGSMFNPVNQSIQAFVSRWFVRSDSNIYYWKNVAYRYGAFFAGIRGCLSDAVGLAVSKAAASVLIAAGFAASFIGLKRRGDDADGAAYSVAILACLLASPIVRVQYFIFAVFPAMLVLGRASSYNIKKRLAGYCLGLFAALYFSLGIKPFRIAGCGAIALVLLYAVIAYGTLSEKTDT